MKAAFHFDGIRVSHPIHVPVRSALDVNHIFDSISYLKSCSTICMLAHYLGVKIFLRGVSKYLNSHAYSNAKAEALWHALTEVSDQVLTVAEKPGKISTKQSRFLSTGELDPSDDTTIWWVPFGLKGKKDWKGFPTYRSWQRNHGVDDNFYLNNSATGFYRVNYPSSLLAKLCDQLDMLTTEGKIAIIGSAADLAFSGHGTTASLLTFLESFQKETHPLVWTQILDPISSVRSVFSEDKRIKKDIENFSVRLICYKLIGLAVTSSHNREASTSCDPETNAVHPSLRAPSGPVPFITALPVRSRFSRRVWFNTKSIDGKLTCLQALSAAEDESLLPNVIVPFNFSSTPQENVVAAAVMRILGGGLAANPIGRVVQWAFMKINWGACRAKLGNPKLVGRFVRVSLGEFTDLTDIHDIESFFMDKDTTCFNRTLGTVKVKIRSRAAYKHRDSSSLKK
ncbi:M1 family metallopeptidase [Aspergillus alliaceus]|uniref:M1 family metallopeptidase n=1 Tax=Petromyces alliaceus TaxID=209559 RepID=UPI0012A4DEA9|nr:ERAP1-like C-terminal domain-containing protein [Aspergillus alliaceus]KAB8237009.1 ERAP1-like C-terminal domain-containing protein [Aspergillus alliaceus]